MNEPKVEAKPLPGARPSFLAWFPWEKTLIWGLFLLAVYVLRHFFFVIFMTFMMTYIMSNIVKRTMRVVSPGRERIWLQRTVALISFVLLLGFLYGVGSFLYQPLKTQAEQLVTYARNVTVNYKSLVDDVLGKTVGAWRFKTVYSGKVGQEKYNSDLEEYRKNPEQAFTKFEEWAQNIDRGFQIKVVQEEGEKRYQAIVDEGNEKAALEAWMIETLDESRFNEKRPELLKDWDDEREAALLFVKRPPTSPKIEFPDYIKSPEYVAEQEHQLKRQYVLRELKQDQAKKLTEFKEALGKVEYDRLRRENALEARFQRYYEQQTFTPSLLATDRYDYEKYKQLRQAQTKEEFEALRSGQNETPEERDKRIEREFEASKQRELARQALGDVEFLQIDNLRKWLGENIPEFTRLTYNFGRGVLELTVQFLLSLLLSFFITFDLPRLRRGLHRLETSRIRDFYREIAPSLASFGRLIGRAFQAQAVIALCNTILTFVAITSLGIQNEVVLCSVVFICSFIPVLGVVLSSVPIAAMAIIQPGGSLWMALMAIGAILIIHFIETSVLNPKILGDMLHLHPVMVLVILAVGEYFFGVWGLLLGVPVAVYIIRHVILDEDLDLPPAARHGVIKVTGVRETRLPAEKVSAEKVPAIPEPVAK